MESSKIFVVGGSVRDVLLHKTPKDIDYVVVGSTPELMISAGFKLIPATSFPVFLHFETNDEYALARSERKTGKGYHGFETDFNPDITLEEDLFRRDLTINSLAVAIEDWEEFKSTRNKALVIDPYNGLDDLASGVLRHTSEAFSEDPVRVLRIARFAARYNFVIAPETIELMITLTDSGELDELTPERIYMEFEKAMMEDSPIQFFKVLDIVGAGTVLFPELIGTGRNPILITKTMERAISLDLDFLSRMIILCANHETDNVQKLFKRLKAPNELLSLLQMSGVLLNEIINHLHYLVGAEQFDNLLTEANGWKNPVLFTKVMKVFIIFDNSFIRNAAFLLLKVLKVGSVVNFDMLTIEQQETLKGKQIGEAINARRLELLSDVL